MKRPMLGKKITGGDIRIDCSACGSWLGYPFNGPIAPCLHSLFWQLPAAQLLGLEPIVPIPGHPVFEPLKTHCLWCGEEQDWAWFIQHRSQMIDVYNSIKFGTAPDKFISGDLQKLGFMHNLKDSPDREARMDFLVRQAEEARRLVPMFEELNLFADDLVRELNKFTEELSTMVSATWINTEEEHDSDQEDHYY